MNYQNYHSWADMLSSLAAIILLISVIGKLAGKSFTFLFKFTRYVSGFGKVVAFDKATVFRFFYDLSEDCLSVKKSD